MATKRNLVAASSINIAKGLKKDISLLQRYIGQEPDDAVELLERCINEGSKKIREAAFQLLARKDISRAEALALEQADIGARARKPKERAERFAYLVEVATTTCLDRAEALGVEIKTLYAHQMANAVEWLQRKLGRERAAGTAETWLRETSGRFAYREDVNAALDWLVSLLDAPDTSAGEREALFDGLVESRVASVCRRADLPERLVPAGAFALDTAECFERLTPLLDRLPTGEASAAFARGNMMWEPVDERWLDYWMRRVDGLGLDHKLAALRALKHAARVDMVLPIHDRIDAAILDCLVDLPWSGSAAEFLRSPAAWSHPAAADIQMKGVGHASETYNEGGHRVIAGMLWAMRDHGRAEHVPKLAAHAKHVASITGGSQAAAAWFRDAIAGIRSRSR